MNWLKSTHLNALREIFRCVAGGAEDRRGGKGLDGRCRRWGVEMVGQGGA